jgi:hypothetical protein
MSNKPARKLEDAPRIEWGQPRPREPWENKLLIALHNKGETDPRYAKITFGRYRGYFMKDVPTQYLEWIILNHTDQAFCEFVKDEYLRRQP